MIKIFEKFIKESYSEELNEIKNIILYKAVYTDNLNLIKFFVEKNYNINNKDILLLSTFNFNIFKYFLKKNADINILKDEKRLNDLEIQKILIDYGYEEFVYNNPGFNYKLKTDPKYKDIVQRFEDAEKYNL